MATWTELITANNISGYIDQDTFVDVRYTTVSVRGLWDRFQRICPFLKDTTAYGQSNPYSSGRYSTNLGFGRSHIYGFPAGEHGMKSNSFGCTLTTGHTDTFNSGDPDGDEDNWYPLVDSNIFKNAIYNPWEGSSYSMEIAESRCEVFYAGQNSTMWNSKVDLGLTWGKFERPHVLLAHQEQGVSGASSPAINVSGWNGDANWNLTSYTDDAGFEPVLYLGGSTQDQVTHKILESTSDLHVMDADNMGHQVSIVKPSAIHNVPGVNEIEPHHGLIPLIGNTLTPGETSTTVNIFGDDVDWDNDDALLSYMLSTILINGVTIKLTTIIRKGSLVS